MGRPYPFSLLAQLGIISALRGRLPQSTLARWVIRLALDAALARDANQVMCSELTYRALAEAGNDASAHITGAMNGAMTPAILVAAPLHLAFPEIDWIALQKELEEMLKPFPQDFFRAIHAGAIESELQTTHSDAALLQDYAQLRAQLMSTPAPAIVSEIALDSILVPNPNPKTVTPGDFERSPSVRFVGRLRLG